MGRSRSSTEYLFEIKLKGAKRISRTIALRGDQSLDDLHEAIFVAFDRFDPHLYSFYFPKAPGRLRTSGPAPREYTSPQMLGEAYGWEDETPFDAAATTLDDLRLKPGQKFEYLFDFGDSWWHECVVKAINPIASKTRYPEIRKARGPSPPQYGDSDE